MAATDTETTLHRESSADSSDLGMAKAKRMHLANLLNDCAALIENNEFDQQKFQEMFREMTVYVKSQGGKVTAESISSSSPSAAAAASTPTSSSTAADPIPDSDTSTIGSKPADPPGATHARKVTTTTTTHFPPPPASISSSRGEKQEESTLSNHKNHKFFDKMKHTFKDVGHEFASIAHTGQRGQSQAAKQATSNKNANRAKADLAAEFGGDRSETRSEASTQKDHKFFDKMKNTFKDVGHELASETRSETNNKPANSRRPPFQRPLNPNSTLIANGWLEQKRRSKAIKVWKEVLVSLVAGRKPGEETTLWVQREVHNSSTGKPELEALHQIPVKGMQGINYIDFSSDHRFVIQVYNLSDEFLFRTPTNAEAAKSWVSTLRMTRDAIKNGIPPPRGADLNAASNRSKYPGNEEEKKAESSPANQSQQHQHHQEQQQQHPQPHTSKKLAISELRAIAHGHGFSTHGMEKGELQELVARIQRQHQPVPGVPTPHPPPGPPPHTRTSSEFTSSSEFDERRHQEADSRREAERLQREEQQREAERRARQMQMDQETAARMAAEERERADAERRRHEVERQKRAQAEAEEQRRRHAEHIRQEEMKRQQQEAERQRQWQAYQQQQRQRQWDEWQRQQWQKQQRPPPPQGPGGYPHPQGHPQHSHPQQPRQQTPPPGPGGHPYPQQQPHAQQRSGGAPPSQPGAPPPGSSPINQKWASQATEDNSSGQAKITIIKHNILVSWALQPPTLQMLRPINDLLTTVHTVFPPTSGVPGHEYFSKWKAYTPADISENGQPTEAKIAKAVKKLRFFLHPDKLPRDLSEEQSFICKMVWDIISDANEEYEKRKDDLDWLNPASSS